MNLLPSNLRSGGRTLRSRNADAIRIAVFTGLPHIYKSGGLWKTVSAMNAAHNRAAAQHAHQMNKALGRPRITSYNSIVLEQTPEILRGLFAAHAEL